MRRKSAQSILESAFLMGILPLIAIDIYLKRTFQGKYRETADELGSQYSPRHKSLQYQPLQIKSAVNQGMTDWVDIVKNATSKLSEQFGD